MTLHWLAIVNPHSGAHRNRKRLRQTLDQLRLVVHRTVLTARAGHAIELAGQSQAYAGVVAVGGDGTLFEILKGIDLCRQRVAIVPAGRGNSLARDLGLMHSRSISDVAHWDKPCSIDLMEVHMTARDGVETTCFSASTIALGYPATVVLRARHMALLGRMSYPAASVVTRPAPFTVRVQYGNAGSAQVRLTGFIANNTRHVANFLAFKRASFCDGVFEVMEMRSGFLKQSLHNLSAFSGSGFYEPSSVRQTHTAQLALEFPQNVVIDGEIFFGIASLDIRILPRAFACNGLAAT